MRFIGLDVGRDFAHVAVVEGSGTARRLPRVAMATTSGRSRRPWDRTTRSPSRHRPTPGRWPTCSRRMRAASSSPTRCARGRSPRPSARPTTSTPPRSPSCWPPTTCRRCGSPTRRPVGCGGWCRTGPGSSATGRPSGTGSPRCSRGSSCGSPMTDVFGVARTRLAGRARAAARRAPDGRRGPADRRRPVRADRRRPSGRSPTPSSTTRGPVGCSRSRASASSSRPRSSRSWATSTASTGRPSSCPISGSTRGSASRGTGRRCGATSAARARPMPEGCCARPPTRRSARRDRWRASMPGSRRGGEPASRSSPRPASSRCSCGTCSPRTRTAGSPRRSGRPSSSAHSTGWRDGQGRGPRNGERLVPATTRVGQGCAAGMIPMTPPFARRWTASTRTLHRRHGA